jgi:hypothetical protein
VAEQPADLPWRLGGVRAMAAGAEHVALSKA